ncbi:glycosyltransferase family 2 protein [Cognatiyoonia sp. IB215446]|uniref:glycosyltransferase family 2 protein n=1 Tax=Cognatiyoonia sp. IB215446 TaxID=3097355 RepID=UPI002A12E127|nr:glycosyltransferase family 2 protein [Cognatiyoonia sp. IB215446]MDX8346996.1 glycosyltransferase family 2 protein [Cognatiyoonia sp. IB215446]
MKAQTCSWAVVATLDEPPTLVAAFVAWHLSLGAAEMHLYFDRPDDPAADLVAAIPQVRVTRCDATYWKTMGKRRPDKHQLRQVLNARDAFAATQEDWLLHCDGDEFLWPEASVAASLDRAGAGAQCLITPVAERFYVTDSADASIFAGSFRRPFAGNPDMGRALFGRGYAMTQRGLTGHAIGKSFLRRGAKATPSIHRPKQKGADFRSEQANGLTLLHFDGLTPAHWAFKILRKADAVANHGGMPATRHRQRQINAVLAAAQEVMAIHDRLKRPDAMAQQHLADRALLLDPDFAPEGAMQALWPDLDFDLSPKQFDAWLHLRRPTLFRQFGLNASD